MQENDREQQLDDDNTARPSAEEPSAPQSPVMRMLANPRRVRRA